MHTRYSYSVLLHRRICSETNPDTIIDAFGWMFFIIAHTALSLPHRLQMDAVYSELRGISYRLPQDVREWFVPGYSGLCQGWSKAAIGLPRQVQTVNI